MLLVLDARPFEDLHHIVQDFRDDRIWVFAEWVSGWGGQGAGGMGEDLWSGRGGGRPPPRLPVQRPRPPLD